MEGGVGGWKEGLWAEFTEHRVGLLAGCCKQVDKVLGFIKVGDFMSIEVTHLLKRYTP